MSSNSYRFFWDSETGSPRTPRPFETSTVTCVDGVNRSLIIPSEDTMQFFVTDDGDRYASIVTPKVRTVARNQFNCQSLAGAQLENQPTGTESCTGDHWDERLYVFDVGHWSLILRINYPCLATHDILSIPGSTPRCSLELSLRPQMCCRH